jgi:hypothetical protein
MESKMNAETKYQEAEQLEAQAKKLREEGRALLLADLRKKPLLERLIFSAFARCPCGAGMVYDPAGASGGYPDESKGEKNDGPFVGGFGGYWDCSAILLGAAVPSGQPGAVEHSDRLPFSFYDIKSEDQPSARGATTRHKS